VASDPNAKRKEQVLDRAKKSGNHKVLTYIEDDFVTKVDQAGPHAGIWLETLENDFDSLAKKPEGQLKHFSEKDFDALFKALFGYERSV
jgi:hypothetical protein